MITLKTLPQATAQQVFDQVVNHLLKQNKRAVKEGTSSCQYRGAGKTKCAAGCLIANDEYDEAMENKGWLSMVSNEFAPEIHKDLIFELQKIHDNHDIKRWEEELKFFAFKNKLQFNYVKQTGLISKILNIFKK